MSKELSDNQEISQPSNVKTGGSIFLFLMNGRDNKPIRIFWKVMLLIEIFMFDTPILKGKGNKWERTTLNN